MLLEIQNAQDFAADWIKVNVFKTCLTTEDPCICPVAINTSFTSLGIGLCHLSIAKENKMGPECLVSGFLLMSMTLASVATKSPVVFCGFNALCLHLSCSLGDL